MKMKLFTISLLLLATAAQADTSYLGCSRFEDSPYWELQVEDGIVTRIGETFYSEKHGKGRIFQYFSPEQVWQKGLPPIFVGYRTPAYSFRLEISPPDSDYPTILVLKKGERIFRVACRDEKGHS